MKLRISIIALCILSVTASAQVTISPNMNLPVPIPGVTPGPAWASSINASFMAIDSHNHSSGQGVQVQPNGININADLPFNSNNAVTLRTARFTPLLSPPASAAPDVGALYVSGNELYFNDVSGGNQVQITVNGSVNAGAGSITGLPSGTASASYSAGTFTWQSATNTAANMDGRSYIYRNSTANSKGLTLNPPSAMGADISETLPAIPGATSFMQMDTSGNMAASIPTANGLTASNIDPAAGLTPAGGVIMYGGASAPTGWLLCDGSAVSRTTYSALFSAIGTVYGVGNGSTTFNVPNAKGVFIRGTGSQTINAVTYTGTRGTSQRDQFAAHHHALWGGDSGGGPTNINNATSNALAGIGTAVNLVYVTNSPSGGHQYVQDSGSGTETEPANIVLTYIIKY